MDNFFAVPEKICNDVDVEEFAKAHNMLFLVRLGSCIGLCISATAKMHFVASLHQMGAHVTKVNF